MSAAQTSARDGSRAACKGCRMMQSADRAGRAPIECFRCFSGGTMAEHKLFELGNFALQTGPVIPNAKIGYATLGKLNTAKDNVVVCPTWFTATPSDVEFVMTGANRFLNPDRFFIVIPNHFGAGVSSSPSNTPPPFEKGRFPHVLTP